MVLLLRSFVMPTMRQRPAAAVAAAAASLPTQPPSAAAAAAAGATHAASQSNADPAASTTAFAAAVAASSSSSVSSTSSSHAPPLFGGREASATKKRKRGPPSADAAAAESKSKAAAAAAAAAARGAESKANNAVDWRVRRIVQDLARLDERRRGGGGHADAIVLSDDDDDDDDDDEEEETAIDMLVREMMAEARRAVAERRTLATAAALDADMDVDRDDEEIGSVAEEYELSICCECLQVEDPTSDIPILLCDVCDAACHLSCARDRPKLAKVPDGDWYCSMCAKKVAAKNSSIAEGPDAQKQARIGNDRAKGDTKAKKKALEADSDNATSKRDLPRGVYKQSGPSFTAQANWSGKTRFIGTFATPEQASAAYMSVKEDFARAKVSASGAEEVDAAFDEAKTNALESFGGFVRKKKNKNKKNKPYGFDSIHGHCKDTKRKGEYVFRVKWNNGHTTMEPDTYLKEDDPTTFITYLRSSGLAKTKKYAWANEKEYV